MVLELLLNPKIERAHKSKFVLVGFLYTLLACGIALLVFPSQSSILSVFLVVLSVAPFMYHMLEREEIKELSFIHPGQLLKEYGNIISVLLLLFLGIVLGYTIMYLYNPDSALFELQRPYIENRQVPTPEHFESIFLNNVIVLLICGAFAFFFGFGAIFVITWNATILSLAIGSSIVYAGETGSVLAFFIAFFQFIPHGIFEIGAYFLAGMGGSFISFGIIHKEYTQGLFSKTLSDGFFLFFLAIICLVFATFIEIMVYPLLFM
ncbi:MAG: stage II sporulation protein M [Candidatus Woesearchaeota archaeon]